METLAHIPPSVNPPSSLPPTPPSPTISSRASTRGCKRRKSSDSRQFPCDRPGCDKSYSRAEHLQRHQLNHDPKKLYFCDVQGCDHVFVRKDLCLRHRLRHERQGLIPPQNSAVRLEDTLLRGQNVTAEREVLHQGSMGDSVELPDQSRRQPTASLTPSSKTTPTDGCDMQLDEPKLLAHNGLGLSEDTARPAVDVTSWSMNLEPTPPTLPPTHPLQHAGAFMDQSTTDCSISLSPSSTDEFTSWLFDDLGVGTLNGLATQYGSPLAAHVVDPSANSFGQLWPDQMETGFGNMGSFMVPVPSSFPGSGQDSSMMAGVLGGTPAPAAQTSPAQLTEAKRQEVLTSILNPPSMQDTQYSRMLRQDLLTGASESETHALSLKSLQGYIDSYWDSFDIQLPIIHRPTFVPEDAPVLQLLAILVVGASFFKSKDEAARSSITGLCQHVAYNLRWQLFMHPAAQPPAQLWVIQSLLLLEVYEKQKTSRSLHERAHVYFPTTLTLMRRGSTLSGRHSPPTVFIPLVSPMELDGGLHNSSPRPETWWDCWVAQESTRRAALTAFIIDSSHAVMFGHTPTLTIHELNLSLPCESNLWKSQSPSEIACVESSLFTNGINPVSFLEGLKKTFNAERVYTTPFGRVALVAGLLSVGWQMQQRELDRRSLGSDGLAGPHERWRPKLLRALDWWRRDVQDSVDRMRKAAFDWKRPGVSAAAGYGLDAGQDDSIFLTWGTLLYHLGHITQHVTMRELCVFAGARRMLGRAVTPGDVTSSLARMSQWSTSLRAINAVWHALQIIKMVLGTDLTHAARGTVMNSMAESAEVRATPPGEVKADMFTSYQAADDKLLPRPWALYFATLVLWAYGYSVDGPIENYPSHLQYPASSSEASSEPDLGQKRLTDLIAYLTNMLPPTADSVQAFHAHQQTPEMIGRRNKVVGLLSVVDEALGGTDWELLAEARERFKNAAATLQGK